MIRTCKQLQAALNKVNDIVLRNLKINIEFVMVATNYGATA